MRASFRDPDGQVEDDGHRIQRRVHPHAAAEVQELLNCDWLAELIRDGRLVGVIEQQRLDDGSLMLQHRRIEIPSYAFEWTPAMLADAARLTLEVQQRAWAQGWTLKDAATSNVLFDGSQPVFCDLLSFQRKDPSVTGWAAYGQFVRHFILPLLAVAELGRSPRDIFLAHRDGLRAAELAPFIRWHAHLGLAMWLHVWLPARLERRRIQRATQAARPAGAKGAADGTPWLLSNLRGLVDRLEAGCRGVSTWSEYTGNRNHYDDIELTAKRRAVQALFADGRSHPQVLDIGANSGEFSMMAIRAGSRVVALDDDINALDDLHRAARQAGQPVQCVHANFARPTPATGWRLGETLDLPRRFAGRFDLVLALAVIHHLTVTERLPTPQLFEAFAESCTGILLLEFVPRDDPRFIEIAGTNLGLYQHWDLDFVLQCAQPWFELQSSEQISEHRTLLLLRRRESSAS